MARIARVSFGNPTVTPRDCYARVAIPRRAMAASQSETAGLLASDDVVRPRGMHALTSWKVIGGGLTVRPRCAILGRDETSPDVFFSRNRAID